MAARVLDRGWNMRLKPSRFEIKAIDSGSMGIGRVETNPNWRGKVSMPEPTDSKPVAQVDGEKLVQQIASSRYCKIIDLLSNHSSEKSLDLTLEAIKLNAENVNIWDARRKILSRLERVDLHAELETIMALGIDLKSNTLWSHRLWIAQNLGTNAMKKELDYTMDYLENKDPCNFGAWLNMDEFSYEHGMSVTRELSLLRKLLKADEHHPRAWGHICSISGILGTTTARKELEFAKNTLRGNAKLKYAWNYLNMLTRRLKTDSLSDTIEFVNEILFTDGENGFAWRYRWEVAMTRIVPLHEELKFTDDILSEKPKNYYAWHYRRWLFQRQGIELVSPECEISFTVEILSRDAKNFFAWYQRQWLCVTFGRWQAELDYCHQLLEHDIDNEYAWNQRSFVVMRLGLGMLEPQRKCEVEYATSAIRKKPESRCAWLYLQCLYWLDFDGINVETILEEVLLRGISDLGEDSAKNSRTYINVLETLRYIMSHDYKPSKKMDAVITHLCSRYKSAVGMRNPGSSTMSIISGVLNSLPSILQFSHPNSLLHWEWNTGRLPELESNSSSEGYMQDLNEVGSCIKKEPHVHELWYRRRELAKELGIDAESELKFAEDFLLMNESKEHAWSHRKWVLEAFGGWEYELKFCNERIQQDTFNGSAWDQRLFVVTKYKREALKDELYYAKERIFEKPENEHSWWYLKSLYKELRVDKVELVFEDGVLDDLFESVLEAEIRFLENIDENTSRLTELIDLEFNIVKSERKLVFALDALLHLICSGYQPSNIVQRFVERMNPCVGGGRFLRAVYLILTFVWPLRAPCWKWLVERVCNLRPELS